MLETCLSPCRGRMRPRRRPEPRVTDTPRFAYIMYERPLPSPLPSPLSLPLSLSLSLSIFASPLTGRCLYRQLVYRLTRRPIFHRLSVRTPVFDIPEAARVRPF